MATKFRFNPFSGNLDAVSVELPAGSDTQVQFNDGGNFGADSGLTFNKATDALSAGAFVPSSATVPANGLYLPAANSVALSTGSSERLRITSAGLVGIGSTAPTRKLVLRDTGVTYFKIAESSLGETTNDGFDLMLDSSATAYVWNRENGALALGTNNTERARIDSSGRLLVGTSSAPSASTSAILQMVGANDGASLIIGNPATTIGLNGFLGGVSFLSNDESTWGAGAQILCLADVAHTSTNKGSRLVFSTTADGASSPTEQLRITSDRYVRLASGTGGIQFNGDTAAANALDDYEEGTFTPEFGTSSGGVLSGATYTSQVGRYVKIGKQVTVYINLVLSNKGTVGFGDARVIGFPTAILSQAPSTGTIKVDNCQTSIVSATARFTFADAGGGGRCAIDVRTAAAASSTQLTGANFFSDTTGIILTATYEAA